MITQTEAILAELEARRGEWVAMPHLVEISGSYNVHSRIADIRAQGIDVENKTQLCRQTGKRMSYYRIPAPEQQELAL